MSLHLSLCSDSGPRCSNYVLSKAIQQDFQGTAVTVEEARKLKVKRLMLVINKVPPKLDFVSLRKQVEATCAAPVTAILPALEEMMELGGAGLFKATFPNHPYRQGVRKIAAQIVNSSEAR